MTYKSFSYRDNTTFWKIDIIDSDFFSSLLREEDTWIHAMCEAIIEIYSSKNLNVAKNLFLFLLHIEELPNYQVEIKTSINYLSARSKSFKNYLPQIQKYLLFN